jgi:hypothetical protein
MSTQSDRATHLPLRMSLAMEAAAVSRKPWATPTVIKGELEDAEVLNGPGPDGDPAPSNS